MKLTSALRMLTVFTLFSVLALNSTAQGYTENFDTVSSLASRDWFMQNNSVPAGSTGWFQGDSLIAGGPFDAYNGAANSYIGADMNNTSGTGDINNWLITPYRTYRNGDIFTFYIRTKSPETRPDRLQVRMSTNGSSTNVGTGASSVGDFSTALLNINPSLVTGIFPTAWTQYTITISGLSAPTPGRIAFRYNVTGGGPSGANSESIGIDNVVYTPYVCPVFVFHPSSFPAGTAGVPYSLTVSITGAASPVTYAITSGSLPPGLSLNTSTGVISGTPTAVGTFSFTINGLDLHGCESDAGGPVYSITINCPGGGATLSVSPTDQICLNAVPPFPFVGSPAGGVYSGSGISGTSYNPTVPGSFLITYTVTDGYGCTKTATHYVDVYSTPTLTVTASPADHICPGQPVSITVSGAGSGASYSWDHTVTSGGGPNPTASFSPPFSDGYHANIVTFAGCHLVAGMNIIVDPLPTVTASSNVAGNKVCSGGSVILSGGGATTYTWSGGVTNGVAFVPSATTTYTVTGTTIYGCSNTSVITIVVNPHPTVTASSNAAGNTVCSGSAITLNGGGASTYIWTGGITNNVAFVPASTVTYTVTGTTTSTGCTGTSTIGVTVNSSPVVTISSTPTSLCAGASVTLTGNGADSYSWDHAVSNGVSFTPASTAVYTVTGTTTATGCTGTAAITVTVNAIPVVTANSNAPLNTVCEGSAITLSGGGAATYSWSDGIINGNAFIPAATTTYTLTGTSAAGCSNTSTITVTVNPLPVITASSDATGAVCSGTAVTLSGAGADTYSWDHGVTDGASFTPGSTATYEVTGMLTSTGCTGTSTVLVTVNPSPVITASSNAATGAVCSGTVVTLSGAGADTYSWDHGVTDGASFTPGSTATYEVTGTLTSTGCTGTSTILVTVNPLPVVHANSNSASDTICAGSSVILSGSGAVSYLWSDGITDGASFIPSATATYTVTGTDIITGCSGTDTINITVNLLPVVDLVPFSIPVCTDGGVVSLNGGTPAGGVFSGASVIGNTFDSSIGLGTYSITYTYTDANGCEDSDSENLDVQICEGVMDLAGKINLDIYPNPGTGLFTVVYDQAVNNLDISITDVQGKMIVNEKATGFSGAYTHVFDLGSFGKGVYFFEISDNGRKIHRKIIVQ